MRKTIVLLFATVMAITSWAQKPSNINGTIAKNISEKVSLFKVYNGRLVEIASSTPDKEGRFAFRFTPEYEGLYSVGTGTARNQIRVYRFYFQGGEELNIDFTEDGYNLVGENTKENEMLFSWDQKSKSFKDKGTTPGGMSTYVDFFPEVEQFKGEVPKIAASSNTGNTKFDALFKNIVEYDFAYYAISYLYMPRSAHPSKEEMSDFYVHFDSNKYLNDFLLDLPYGDRFLGSLVYRKIDLTSNPSLKEQVQVIPSDVLKGQYVLQRIEGARSYDAFEELYNENKQYFILDEQKQRVTAVQTKLVETKAGGKAFNFNFPDADGNEVSLESLKGKVVLVDLWATWCGPCKAEEPHWEKLNEEYKGKDVAFVGVSVDQDKEAWKKYIPEKGLKGIQLHAGPRNPLSIAYEVTGIPRYILIDKSGNLITADSPRPSNPELRTLLDEWIKK